MGLRAGVCSVTFRHLEPDAIIGLAVEAGVDGIEWGGDVHAPPGDPARAATIRRRCSDAGLACPSYGSYLFATQADRADIDGAVETALALGVSTVRIWCPFGTNPASPPADKGLVVDGVAGVAEALLAEGLAPALEFHPGTLTETATSTLALLDAAGVPDLTTYWQPAPGAEPAVARAEYDLVADAVSNLHVFWWRAGAVRRPLADGLDLWVGVLGQAASVAGPDRWAHLEFVAGDDPGQFLADAATLTRWLGENHQFD